MSLGGSRTRPGSNGLPPYPVTGAINWCQHAVGRTGSAWKTVEDDEWPPMVRVGCSCVRTPRSGKGSLR